MDALLLELAKALIWMLAGVLACSIVTMWRGERAEAARDDARVQERFGDTLARWSSASEAPTRTAPRRPGFLDRFLAGWAALTSPPQAEPPAEAEQSATGALDPQRTVDAIFTQVARGSAQVNRPFDEQIRDRNDVLHGRFTAAANDADTTLLPGPVVSSGGAR